MKEMGIVPIFRERNVERLFEKFHKFFGFDRVEKIYPYKKPTYGDYIAWRGNKSYRVEVEVYLSGFFNHSKEVRDKIDVIVTAVAGSRIMKTRWDELKNKEVIILNDYFDICIITPKDWAFLLVLNNWIKKEVKRECQVLALPSSLERKCLI